MPADKVAPLIAWTAILFPAVTPTFPVADANDAPVYPLMVVAPVLDCNVADPMDFVAPESMSSRWHAHW